ncbi:LLM class flavin-dependent oxidoreductase [Mycobacterium sp. OTB74]|uniref:LLM class flavin-dependent oxidoreductase n=1 Tax=Mycobacterium sp. OTB74 TaxID=1853452 RepID=UPI0024748811|nr:LLM class flavin-dependent oxidoreductase [Mycobacterium sp. OTB74]MDH6243261.1 alkanesulfonate monooxygenase SsuD/methylene tetrahydromethanopterin reductase-like flavin-dependent oxidoreductase (luciferase family) [Mycobacterium sp. OTB74]
MVEWFLYLPQSRIGIGDLVERSQAAEVSGFDGVAFLDHVETPMAPEQPIWEAMTVATWVAAHTARLRIGHVVLCDAFRHPAVLAKQAVTLAEASGGRFELGLGSGSMADELAKFDITTDGPQARIEALGETLRLLTNYWGDGENGMAQAPTPTRPIPILLGGTGPRMLNLVREHADWWNLPATKVDRLREYLPSIGSARVSVQQMVAFIRDDTDRDTVIEKSRRRFGHLGPGLVCGNAGELIEYFRGLERQGAQRFYVWFADSAPVESISDFGQSVIDAYRR